MLFPCSEVVPPGLPEPPPPPRWSHLLLTPAFLAGKARDGQREDMQRFNHGRTTPGPRSKGLGGKGSGPGEKRLTGGAQRLAGQGMREHWGG